MNFVTGQFYIGYVYALDIHDLLTILRSRYMTPLGQNRSGATNSEPAFA